MNWVRGFRRIKQVLVVVGALFGFFFGGNMSAGFVEGEDNLIVGAPIVIVLCAIVCAAICYGLTRIIYEFLEWIVLGFCDEKPKDEQKE